MRKSIYLASLGLVAFTMSARAQPTSLIDWNDLDGSVGFGANRTGIVIDWNDGGTPDVLRWGYFWDSAPGGGHLIDLLNDLETQDPRLDFSFTDFGGTLGFFTDAIGFDAAQDGTYTDPEDHLQDRMGGFAATFGIWEGNPGDPSWTSSSAGVSSLPVLDEYVYAFSWDADGFGGEPYTPAVVPEPSSFALIGLAGLVLGWMRRRKQ